MPTAPPTLCPRCRQPSTTPCPTCTLPRRRRTDKDRGSAHTRGYGTRHQHRFRQPILRRDTYCTCTDTTCRTHRHRDQCTALATIADHWPLTRRELTARGLDPDDPQHGRGLCKTCHDHATATDPRTHGGWHKPAPHKPLC